MSALVITFISAAWILPIFAGPAVGAGFYLVVFLYYRKSNVPALFEREEASSITNLRSTDVKVGENHGTSEPSVQGRNSEKHFERVNRV